MKHLAKTVSFTLLLAIISLASAQSNDIPHKEKYDRTQALPVGVAFVGMLEVLDHFNSNGDTEFAVEWIRDKLDMDKTEAATFMAQALSVKQAIAAGTRLALSSHACKAGDGYDLLDQTYDIEESIADQYYEETKLGLDTRTSVMLDRWMSEQKANIVYTRIDFEKADQKSGRDSTAVLTQLCRGIDQ